MSLGLTWAQTYTATSTATVTTFTIPGNVTVGSFIVLAIGRGGAGLVNSMPNIGSNVWVIERTGTHSTNTFNVCLATMRVTSNISSGTTFTIGASATSNRWTVSGGVFDDVIMPPNKSVMSAVLSTATPTVDCGPTPNLVVSRALVVTAVAITAAGSPIDNRGNALASQTVTTVGSADRGCALLYKYEGGYPHTGSFDVTASSSSVSATGAYQSGALPAGSLAVMTENGERSGKLYYYLDDEEIPVTALERS